MWTLLIRNTQWELYWHAFVTENPNAQGVKQKQWWAWLDERRKTFQVKLSKWYGIQLSSSRDSVSPWELQWICELLPRIAGAGAMGPGEAGLRARAQTANLQAPRNGDLVAYDAQCWSRHLSLHSTVHLSKPSETWNVVASSMQL